MSISAAEAVHGFLSNDFHGAGSTSLPGEEPTARNFGEAGIKEQTQTIGLNAGITFGQPK